ncbi:MAG: phosphoribosylformylglycinamidine cyclo-ligase [Rhodospirillales bacterium]|nr:phosphoribosylformylglycinamidine cyclo-ligase [Rhodospirillales bacterium]
MPAPLLRLDFGPLGWQNGTGHAGASAWRDRPHRIASALTRSAHVSPSDAPRSAPLTYKEAGVDIETGEALISAIRPLAKATARTGVMGGLGGFGALFDLKAAGFQDPILVSGTDGVGTKLKIAIETGRHADVGIDLVAMCVNDLLVQGATPLFFLDYFASAKLEPQVAETVIAGIAEGCRQAGAALIGGETAELPGLYAAGDYDLAGFSVGAVERNRLLPRGDLQAGDLLLALPSSGLHSNGFSLVRRLIEEQGLKYDAPVPFESQAETLGAALLTPTRIYAEALLPLLAEGKIKAMAHITGGGLPGNLPRVLPDSLVAEVDPLPVPLLPVFAWIHGSGLIEDAELLRAFNMGIGMVLAVEADAAGALLERLAPEGAFALGRLVPRAAGDAPLRHCGPLLP